MDKNSAPERQPHLGEHSRAQQLGLVRASLVPGALDLGSDRFWTQSQRSGTELSRLKITGLRATLSRAALTPNTVQTKPWITNF